MCELCIYTCSLTIYWCCCQIRNAVRKTCNENYELWVMTFKYFSMNWKRLNELVEPWWSIVIRLICCLLLFAIQWLMSESWHFAPHLHSWIRFLENYLSHQEIVIFFHWRSFLVRNIILFQKENCENDWSVCVRIALNNALNVGRSNDVT